MEQVLGYLVQLIVVTKTFVKIYMLSHDNINTLRYLTMADDVLRHLKFRWVAGK